MTRIIAVESSCDETGVAIYDDELGLIANELHTQIPVHAEYGGVVPELAGRDHVRKTLPLIKSALKSANADRSSIDAVAYTAGPGLVGALMVGATVARTLAYAWDIPAVPVNHMEGHLLAPMLEDDRPDYPFLALLVSGGHTMIVKVSEYGKYELMGESIDDAAGEAFDKTAKLLGLPYPGGVKLSALAQSGRAGKFKFPRPMLDRPGFDFSFSGLKTSAATAFAKSDGSEQTKADIALAFEEAVVDTLVTKVSRAMRVANASSVIVAGGVSANLRLRERLSESVSKNGGKAYYPRTEFCTDNGAMIAYAGMQRFKAGVRAGNAIEVFPRWPLSVIR